MQVNGLGFLGDALSTQVEARWHWDGLGDLVNASGASFTDGEPAQSG